MLGLEAGYVTKGKLKDRIQELDQAIAEKKLPVEKGRGRRKPQEIRQQDKAQEPLTRWNGYDEKQRILGSGRNSYSKTDPDCRIS